MFVLLQKEYCVCTKIVKDTIKVMTNLGIFKPFLKGGEDGLKKFTSFLFASTWKAPGINSDLLNIAG